MPNAMVSIVQNVPPDCSCHIHFINNKPPCRRFATIGDFLLLIHTTASKITTRANAKDANKYSLITFISVNSNSFYYNQHDKVKNDTPPNNYLFKKLYFQQNVHQTNIINIIHHPSNIRPSPPRRRNPNQQLSQPSSNSNRPSRNSPHRLRWRAACQFGCL